MSMDSPGHWAKTQVNTILVSNYTFNDELFPKEAPHLDVVLKRKLGHCSKPGYTISFTTTPENFLDNQTIMKLIDLFQIRARREFDKQACDELGADLDGVLISTFVSDYPIKLSATFRSEVEGESSLPTADGPRTDMKMDVASNPVNTDLGVYMETGLQHEKDPDTTSDPRSHTEGTQKRKLQVPTTKELGHGPECATRQGNGKRRRYRVVPMELRTDKLGRDSMVANGHGNDELGKRSVVALKFGTNGLG